MLLFVFIHISRTLFFVCLYVSRCPGCISSPILLLYSTFYHSSCPAVSAQVSSSSSILSSSCSMSSSIVSSSPASSRAVRVQYCRPRCLCPRRTLRLRPFLFVPNEDDWDEEEDEGEDGLDFNRGLWPCVEEREGGWLGSVWQPEEMQGAWCSWSGCGADVEDGQTVEESGASKQPAPSVFAGTLWGESGPLLVWDSSVIGGSASSWIVGTDASRLSPL